MIRASYIGIVLTCLFFGDTLPSQAQDSGKLSAINTLLTHSAIETQLSGKADGFRGTANQLNLHLDPAQKQMLIDKGTAAFDSIKLAGYVTDYFLDHYQEEYVAEATVQLDSDYARAVESTARNESSSEELQQYAQGLQSNPPSQERLQLIQRMSRAQQAPPFYVRSILGLNQAVINAARVIDPAAAQNRTPPDTSQIKRMALNLALVSFLYMYQDVPRDPLVQYLEFYESDAGQWYVTTYSDAINYAIERASAELNAELRKMN